MPQILIIADDLSGAADCGIACASVGLSASVVLGDGANALNVDVLSVDADTRSLEAKKAAAEIARLIHRYGVEGQLLFKKLDSTLRGNVDSELAAALRAQRDFTSQSERVVAIFAPAFPAHGRTTVHGRQLLKGFPLGQTEIWKREGRSGTSHILEILCTSGMRVTLVEIESVRSGDVSLGQKMRALSETSDILVCDAETDDDLRTIAHAGMGCGRSTVWAGSAGLAYHLPGAAGLAPTGPPIGSVPLASGSTLFVVGTASQTSRNQVETLRSSGTAIVEISSRDLLAGPESPGWPRQQLLLSGALQTGRDVVALLAAEGSEVSERLVLPVRALVTAFAEMLAPYARGVGGLVATGGETARAVLRRWGVSQLRLFGELEPGLPIATSEIGGRCIPVLTKAGDFGDPNTLLRCHQFLRTLDRTSTAGLYYRTQA